VKRIDSRSAIVGVGHTSFARAIPGVSLLGLEVQAARTAIADAGLTAQDVDSLLTWDSPDHPRHYIETAEVLGLTNTSLCATVRQGGAAAGLCVEIADWALRSGRAENVLIVAGAKESAVNMTDMLATLTVHYPDYEVPYGPLMVSFYALLAQRHMYEYGTTEEELAAVSVAFRHNASLNPDAVYRKPITVDDVLNSRMISSPFHMLQCSIVNDGALAFVMTSAERARDLKHRPIYVLGQGAGMAGYFTGFLAVGGADHGYSLTTTLGSRAARDAYAAAGVSPADIDLVSVTDSFAINPILALEDYGFCSRGEGGAFIDNGDAIKVGGRLPMQTHGGMLSCNHAGTSFHNFVEATQQLRGDCGERQVKDAQLALVGSIAGVFSTHYVTILSAQ
jgi:acetyl-CoA acetyltransferase